MTVMTSGVSESMMTVAGLNCSGCVATLTRKALGVYGVVHLDVDLEPGGDSLVTVRHSAAVDGAHLSAALSELGYRVTFPVSA